MASSILTGQPKSKQRHRTQIRHDDHLESLIEKALIIQGTTKSEFIRNAIAKEAQRVITDNTIHHLTPEDAKLFEEALDKPLPLTPRALKAAESFRRRVVYAE